MSVTSTPEGYHSVTPALVVENAAELIEFMATSFGATERMRMPNPAGGIAHAEMNIGDSVVMVGDASPENPALQGSIHLYVDDVDGTYTRAITAGATSSMPPENCFWGDRVAEVRDKSGNRWTIATHVEDVTEAEMMNRMAAMAEA